MVSTGLYGLYCSTGLGGLCWSQVISVVSTGLCGLCWSQVICAGLCGLTWSQVVFSGYQVVLPVEDSHSCLNPSGLWCTTIWETGPPIAFSMGSIEWLFPVWTGLLFFALHCFHAKPVNCALWTSKVHFVAWVKGYALCPLSFVFCQLLLKPLD